MFREAKPTGRSGGTIGTRVVKSKVNSNNSSSNSTNHSHTRRSSKVSLHNINTVDTESKYLAEADELASQEEKELQQITKMIKSHSLNDRKSPDSFMKRIIPKYKPNSKILHKTPPTSVREKLKPTGLIQPLKQSASHADTDIVQNNQIRSSSCIKITQPHSGGKTAQAKLKATKRTRKVRFDKKITVHYVPSDEERGSYEWRKNLTRQGIYQAMLWKSELEKIELEEAMIRSTSNKKEALAAYGLNY